MGWVYLDKGDVVLSGQQIENFEKLLDEEKEREDRVWEWTVFGHPLFGFYFCFAEKEEAILVPGIESIPEEAGLSILLSNPDELGLWVEYA